MTMHNIIIEKTKCYLARDLVEWNLILKSCAGSKNKKTPSHFKAEKMFAVYLKIKLNCDFLG